MRYPVANRQHWVLWAHKCSLFPLKSKCVCNTVYSGWMDSSWTYPLPSVFLHSHSSLCASLTTSLQMALYHYPKYPFRKKTSSKQLRFLLSHQRGAECPPRFLLSHPEGLLRRISSIKHWEITMLCTSNLLYCKSGRDLVGKWVLTYRNPCSTFPWSLWSLPLLRIGWWVEQTSVMTLSGNSYGSNWNLTRSQSVSKDLQSGLQCQ